MSNLWFRDMVQDVIGDINFVVGAGAPDRSVQINAGGFLAGFGTWLGQTTGEFIATTRTDNDSALVMVPFSATQAVAILRISDGTLPRSEASVTISGVGVPNSDSGTNTLLNVQVEAGDADAALIMTAKDGDAGSFMAFIQHSNANTPNVNTSEIIASNGVDDPQQITLNDQTTGVNSIVLAPGPGGGVLVCEDPNGCVGFYGATPVVQPTVAGAKLALDVVMASLLTALAAQGLIVDATT